MLSSGWLIDWWLIDWLIGLFVVSTTLLLLAHHSSRVVLNSLACGMFSLAVLRVGEVSSVRWEIFAFDRLECSGDGESGTIGGFVDGTVVGGRRRVVLVQIWRKYWGGYCVEQARGVIFSVLCHNDRPVIPCLLVICSCTGCCNVLLGRLATTTIDHCGSIERVCVAFVAITVFVDLDDNTSVERRVQLCRRCVRDGARGCPVRSYPSVF